MNTTVNLEESMKIDRSMAPAMGWVRKALCAGVIMSLSMAASVSFAAHNDKANNGNNAMTPFARIAKIPVVQYENGRINREATYNKAKRVALDIARYIAHVDDAADDGTNFPANWIVGGLEGGEDASDNEINGAILRIPSPDLIDPKNPELGIKKANVMDLCNAYYAKQALGVAPITADGKKVVNGYSHTPALPCELATWNDDEHIYVDMLDPNAIFTLFFTDVFVSEEMQDSAFAEAISALPPAVKGEIKTAVYNALDQGNGGAGYNYKATDQAIGPKYKDLDAVFDVVATSPNVSPFKHVAYTKPDNADGEEDVFGLGETHAVAEAIIQAMTIHGEPDAGDQVDELESILSPDSYWRSARHEPLGLPGKPEKNWVIEACSPTYAKMAMGTGMHHATALPCEISVQRVDRDNNGSTESLVISYLDPNFMLGALFADMSDKEKEALGGIPALILGDLETIVQYALDNSGTELNDGVQIWYTMF
jgi:hypothetical protein